MSYGLLSTIFGILTAIVGGVLLALVIGKTLRWCIEVKEQLDRIEELLKEPPSHSAGVEEA